jgi:hypothetical protein
LDGDGGRLSGEEFAFSAGCRSLARPFYPASNPINRLFILWSLLTAIRHFEQFQFECKLPFKSDEDA